MFNQAVRPSHLLYGLGIVIMTAGGVLFLVLFLRDLGGLADKLTQVIVPGERDVMLSEVGVYTVFHEFRSIVGNRFFSTEEELSGLECVIREKKTGMEIPVRRPGMNSSYSCAGRAGVAIFEFEVERPGLYTLDAGYAQGQAGTDVVLTVGYAITQRTICTAVCGLGALFGSGILGTLVMILGSHKRARERQLLGY